MFAGAGSYATFTFGGSVAIEGTGTVMNLSGGVTGAQELAIRNTSAGTTNYAAVKLGNDGAANVGFLAHTSSSFTATGSQPQDGLSLRSVRAGGVSIAAEHASGVIKFYGGGTTERMRVGTAGSVYIGDTSNTSMTIGLTINQAGNDDEAFALKSSDVAHGTTTIAETDTYYKAGKLDGAQGGSFAYSFRAGNTGGAAVWRGVLVGSGDTTKATNSFGFIQLEGWERSGTTVGPVTANSNLLVVASGGGLGVATTRFILDADGDSHQDVGTAWTNFDDGDDLERLNAVAVALAREGDPLRLDFIQHFESCRDVIEHMPGKKLVTFNDDGHHFVNMSRLAMLHTGAIRQLGTRLAQIERRLLEA